jgi:hypothetical protein
MKKKTDQVMPKKAYTTITWQQHLWIFNVLAENKFL